MPRRKGGGGKKKRAGVYLGRFQGKRKKERRSTPPKEEAPRISLPTKKRRGKREN